MKYYKILEDFDPEFPIKLFEFAKLKHQVVPFSKFNPEFMRKIRFMNLKMSHAELFWYVPGRSNDPHIDKDVPDYPKVNWYKDGRGSKMYWYNPIDENNFSMKESPGGTPYINYDIRNLRLACQADLVDTVAVVQAAIIHNVKNGYEDRWCLSTVYQDITTGTFLPFDEIVNRFEKISLL